MRQNDETLFISDSKSGAQAAILPGMGFNCFRFTTRTEREDVDVIWAPEKQEPGKNAPACFWGIPILFPFPGRIRDGQFSFRGKEYRLPTGDGLGNALHGFVLDRPWKVLEQCEDRVVGQYDALESDPQFLEFWPADFQITVSYRVSGNVLRFDFVVKNKDPESPLPFGLGLHPYFRVPLGSGEADSCRVVVPAEFTWELDSRLLPSGKQIPVGGLIDLRNGRLFPDTDLDHVFGGLRFQDGCCTLYLEDGKSSHTLWLKFPDIFQCCVVYNPPNREAICLEPYSCVPDPFTLGKKGIETGLRILHPGQSVQGWMHIGVDHRPECRSS